MYLPVFISAILAIVKNIDVSGVKNIDVSGFTFIKGGIDQGHPFVAAIESIAPLCDEVVINVGFDHPKLADDDGTYQLIKETFSDPKFVIIKSWWDPSATSGGLILSQQTNIALAKCRGRFCQYIQGDEAIHQDDYQTIRDDISRLEENSDADGLVFQYTHFYSDPSVVKHTRNTYRREVRIIRNHRSIVSWRDAQGFRFENGSKINCLMSNARIYHYGWARSEQVMDKKNKNFAKLYHGSDHREQDFRYNHIWGLKAFEGTHPRPMGKWVEKNRNATNVLSLPLQFEWKNIGLAISDWFEKLTGHRLGEYKNYIIVKGGPKIKQRVADHAKTS